MSSWVVASKDLASFEIQLFVRGCHVYWTPQLGETLSLDSLREVKELEHILLHFFNGKKSYGEYSGASYSRLPEMQTSHLSRHKCTVFFNGKKSYGEYSGASYSRLPEMQTSHLSRHKCTVPNTYHYKLVQINPWFSDIPVFCTTDIDTCPSQYSVV